MSIALFQRHALPAILALLIVIAARLLIPDIRALWRDADDYMIVNRVEVADHVVGDDAPLIYDREIIRPFTARWYARVYRIGDDDAPYVCTGSGSHDYDPQDRISTRTLSWYLDAPCVLPPGRYTIHTRWVTDDGPIIRNTSNIFEVTQ